MLGLGSGINRLSAAEAAAIAGRIPGFTGLLDESYGASAEAAYSVRKLTNRVSVAMTIRRDSDSTETDIGFDSNGNLDEGAITAFCTGTTCRVASWKDQSGNDNHAVQAVASNQPTIYTGGALVKEGGKVAVQFNGVNDGLLTSGTTLMYESDYTAIFLARTNNVTSTNVFISGGSSGTKEGRVFFHLNDRLTQGFFGASTGSNLQTITANTQNLYYSENTGFHTGETYETKVYIDGGNLATATGTGLTSPTGTSAFAIGINNHLNSGTLDGKIQETIIYPSVITANRNSIEENIGDYFTQNTPLLDTYTGAAAAYSLRKLSSSYSGPAIRVRRDNDNLETDINFNVFGELDTVSLAAHCGSNNGYVTNWYDQSSNSNTARETTAANQPKIYDSTTGVLTLNGKPYVNCQYSTLPTGLSISQAFQIFTVARLTAGPQRLALNSNNSISWELGSGVMRYRDLSAGTELTGTLSHSTSQINLYGVLANGTGTATYLNGQQDQTGTTSTGLQNLFIFTRNTPQPSATRYAFEFIVYDSDQSANRTGIESNINTFYGI